MSRFVIWSSYKFKIYEVKHETLARLYGSLLKDETDRFGYSQKWIDKRQAIAEVNHEDRETAISIARALVERLLDIKDRRDAEEGMIGRKYDEEQQEVLESFPFKPQTGAK